MRETDKPTARQIEYSKHANVKSKNWSRKSFEFVVAINRLIDL